MLDFRNKKVTVMGLGLYQEGSGIAATRFLVERGAMVTVTDLKTAEQLKKPVEKIKRFVETHCNASLRRGLKIYPVKFVLGQHRAEDFKNKDLVVKNPGVPNNSKYLQLARKNKIPIETDISLFFQLVERKRIIGITGTRGKSTTATLIYEIIKTADKKAVLGGNITKSPLAQTNQVKKGGMIILELSSWMLESLEPNRLSPHLAVVTNIYPDHLNTYRGMADYARAKENIFRWQNPQDYIILNRDNTWTKEMGGRVPSKRFWFFLKEFKEENGCFIRGDWILFRRDGKEEKILKCDNIKLLGEHNLENILAAVGVGMIFGVKPVTIARVVKNFKGVPNRLEFLREVKGVKYYNDTTSTTPEAAIAALGALKCPPCPRGGGQRSRKAKLARGVGASARNIILIAGGSDKGLDFKKLVEEIKKDCKAVVFLKGSGTERIKKILKIRNLKLEIREASSMSEAVIETKQIAKAGDIVLLSPACASFGMFNNEFDRGGQFRRIVMKLR